MTPIFPPESDNYCFDLTAHKGPYQLAEFQGPFMEEFFRLTRNRELKFVVVDTQRVRLPPYFKGLKVEHVRGLGFQVWASSHKRIGMGA